MIISIYEYRNVFNSDKNCFFYNFKLDISGNVVFFLQKDVKKEKVRVNFLCVV